MVPAQNSLTEGSILKKMILFAFPVFLGNVFQQFYTAFDSWVVGNYLGKEALAAVGSSGSLIFMMIGFFNGIAMGAGVVITRYYGAKDYKTMQVAIHTVVAFGLVAGVLLTVLGVIFTPTILRWMGTPDNVLPQSIIYFRYYFYGGLFTVMYNIFVGILHAVGDSRHPLYYLMCSTAVNMVLDLVLVGGFHCGVGAAALATTVSQGISAVLCCIRLIRYKTPYQLHFKQIRFEKNSFRQIISYGLPSGVQNSVIALANLVVQANINSFGDAAMAGCSAYMKIEGFAFLPITCFAQALATFVGQNLGAQKYDRVKKGVLFGVLCSTSLAELIGVISYLFAPQLIGIFNRQPDVISYGVRHMRVICLFYFLLAFSHCIAGILRGAGKSSVPMIIMLGFWCILRVSYITIVISHINRLEVVSWAYPLTWLCSSVAFLIYFLKADWMHAFEHQDEKRKQRAIRK